MLYPQPRLVQTAFASVTTNVSTTSTTYTDLTPLTLTISTLTNVVEVHVCACVEVVSATATIGLQLLIDGVVVDDGLGRIQISGNPGYTTCISLNYLSSALTEGSHTIKVQWKTSASTAQIRPASFSYGYAGLLVKELAL
jgi:hypothetical protein